jgi:Glycosyltransferase
VAVKRILLMSPVNLSSNMAGPAIRYYHLYKELKKHFDVKVIVPDLKGCIIEEAAAPLTRQGIIKYVKWADVVIVQGTTLFHYPSISTKSKCLIVDLYDPFILENLELRKNRKFGSILYDIDLEMLRKQLLKGDFFLCSNQRQLDFWVGSLCMLGKIKLDNYSTFSKPSNIIAVVPMGISSAPPTASPREIRSSLNLKDSDFLVTWAGGVWEWLDIESVLSAFELLSRRSDNIKLLIMGGEDNPHVKRFRDEHKLHENIILTDWIPYEEREKYLLASDVGIIAHYDILETRYSHRTRVLDYIWSGIPVITTEGDYFADYVEKEQIGRTVRYRDPESIANTLLELSESPSILAKMRSRINQVREEFFWENTLAPLICFCKNPITDPCRKQSKSTAYYLLKLLLIQAKKKMKLYKRWKT